MTNYATVVDVEAKMDNASETVFLLFGPDAGGITVCGIFGDGTAWRVESWRVQ